MLNDIIDSTVLVHGLISKSEMILVWHVLDLTFKVPVSALFALSLILTLCRPDDGIRLRPNCPAR